MATRDPGWSAVLPRQACGSVLTGLRLQDVAAALDDGLGVFDASGTSLESNPAMRRLLGAGRGDLPSLTHPSLRLLDETGRALSLAESPVGRVLATGLPVPGAVLGVAVAGQDLRWVRMAALPTPVPAGNRASSSRAAT